LLDSTARDVRLVEGRRLETISMTTIQQHLLAMAAAATAALLITGCRQPTEVPPPNVIVISSDKLPDDPADDAWNQAPEYTARLVLQDLVEPRLMAPSTSSVRVRAVTDGAQVAFRLQWDDDSENKTAATAEFPDACAVQLPTRCEPTVPAPQMGEPGRPVEVTYWNAAWQKMADGGGSSITDLHPHAAIDHYPFQAKSLAGDPAAQQAMAKRYAPAQALGNLMAGPRKAPVEDLIAEGPGTLRRAASAKSGGNGTRTASGWMVVLTRPLPEGFSSTVPTQVAFAIWRGERQEVGAKKMRTGWITLAMEEQP
jgi:DMSO reductase family type II enzyme heme b subunit